MKYVKYVISSAAKNKVKFLLLTLVFIVAAVISAYNLAGYPMRFEDEGTYISQAWAMQYWHQLAHYTYWYDHPPAGWAQLAGWTALTNGYERYDSAIAAGREFIFVMKLLSCGLLYVLARRIGLAYYWALTAVLLYALSPLAVTFGRYVLLDNIALPWLLGAFVLALSPRKSIASVAGSAFCIAIAILTKETFILLLPVLMYALWQNSDKRNRRFSYLIFSAILALTGSFYILYATLKGELFEGADHVSLVGAIKWQLMHREGSGSIFEQGSNAHGLMMAWLDTDPWLLLVGIALIPVALYLKNLRIAGLALALQALLLLRTGYLPFPYIIAMLPFAALVIAGVGNALSDRISQAGQETTMQQMRAGTLVLASFAFLILVVPFWADRLREYGQKDADKSARDAVAWISSNVGRDERLVIDSGLWVDLVAEGFTDPRAVWLYKTETDPEVSRELGGWQGIDYIAVTAPTLDEKNSRYFPTLFKARENAQVAAEFGQGINKIMILRVDDRSNTTASR